jgi:hypothetical protein
MPHKLLRLRTQHALLALRISLRNQLLSKMLADIIHNCRGFSENDFFLRPSGRNANDRRSLQWMHGAKVVACTEVLVALEDFELVLKAEFFKQPYCTLASRLLEPVGG